jgi:hypothetical protein
MQLQEALPSQVKPNGLVRGRRGPSLSLFLNVHEYQSCCSDWTCAHDHVLRALDRICNDAGRYKCRSAAARPPRARAATGGNNSGSRTHSHGIVWSDVAKRTWCTGCTSSERCQEKPAEEYGHPR